jgi:hypothetical protein
LIHGTGRIVLHPWDLIRAGILMYWEVGFIDWEILLETRHEIEQAIVSGVFDDDLAMVQHPDLKQKLGAAEDWFTSVRPDLKRLFQLEMDRAESVAEVVAFARSKDVFLNNVRYDCQAVLGHEVDWQYAARFSQEFPPINAKLCAFFIGHIRRNEARLARNHAGAMDLLAATYLPLCDRFVSNDRNQQEVFRDVVRCCSLQTQVLWFDGDFRMQFKTSSKP